MALISDGSIVVSKTCTEDGQRGGLASSAEASWRKSMGNPLEGGGVWLGISTAILYCIEDRFSRFLAGNINFCNSKCWFFQL